LQIREGIVNSLSRDSLSTSIFFAARNFIHDQGAFKALLGDRLGFLFKELGASELRIL